MFRASVFIALTTRTAGTADSVNHYFVHQRKQTKLQKDARHEINRNHNLRRSDHA
jgi:hypothetical protein